MSASPGARLRARLAQGLQTVAPGAFDGMSARLVAEASFPAVYASGGAISRSLAVPDLGLLSMNQVVERVAAMCDAVDIPVIADADTGYGNALNTQRAVQAFERAGVAAISRTRTSPSAAAITTERAWSPRPRWHRSCGPRATRRATPISC